MARLFTAGFEVQEPAAAVGGIDFVSSGTNAGTYNTNLSFVRSGGVSGKIDSGAGNATSGFRLLSLAMTSKTNYIRIYVYIPAFPSAGCEIIHHNTTARGFGVRLNTDGTVQLWNPATNTSLSATTAQLQVNTWHCIEVLQIINATPQITDLTLRVDYNLIVSVSGLTLTVNATEALGLGWLRAGVGVSTVLYFDDAAVNDSTGASQNSYPGEGKVVLLKPTSLNANGGSWTDDAAATTSAALFTAIDNTPPNGIADTIAGGGNHQDRNAAANTSLDMNMTDYTTAGVAATDRIRVVIPIINTGAPVVTGAKTGSVGVVSNPTITNIAFVNGGTAAANFWSGTTAGTYPTGWKWEKGTTIYDPTVTPGTSPVMRVTITGGTTSRIAMVDFMGMYVEYSPRRSLIHNEVRRRNLQKMIGR